MSICSTHSSGRRAGGDGLPERVQVHDHEVERLHAQLGELLAVRLQAQVGEDSGMHARVQGLDPAVQALGEAGQLLDLGDRDTGRGDLRGGGAGGHELDAGLVQPAGELLQPRLVVDAYTTRDGWASFTDMNLSSLNAVAVTGQTPHDLDEQLSLDFLDALVQSGFVVLVPDPDHALRDDRAGVDPVVDEVDGAPVTFTP